MRLSVNDSGARNAHKEAPYKCKMVGTHQAETCPFDCPFAQGATFSMRGQLHCKHVSDVSV